MAFAFFYDLPFKVGEYNRAAARMREQEGVMREEAKRMENERIALGNESNRLEKERLALDSSTREMEVERDALESAIHRSELERSRLERDKQELENERQLLEEERWRLEREKRELESERQLLEEVRRSLKRERQELEDERRLLEEEGQRLEWEKQELEGERQLLEEERRKFKREKQLLESERHLSEQERSRLEQEKQLWENERHLSEQERGELRKERERWEKAREDRVPQGAFWEDTWPAWDCRAYGKREYWGILQNIPEDWTDVDACMNMPTEIKGVSIRRPHRCAYVEGSPHIHGYWMVDWDQPDCRPWHQDLTDKVSTGKPWSDQSSLISANFKGCTNPGSGTRRLEAWVVGINDRPEQDWRLLCESTPMTWNHITYNSPTHCEAGVSTILTCVL